MNRSIAPLLAGLLLAGCGESPVAITHTGERPAALFVAGGATGTGCTRQEPCGTFEAAYTAAKAGQVIEIAPGAYGKQLIPALPKPGSAVEFRAKGKGVEVEGLEIKADRVVVRGVTSTHNLDVTSDNPADPVEDVRLYDVHTATHYLLGARNFSWRRGSIGPSVDAKASMIGGTPASHRVTYDRIKWHDATRTSADVHTECLLALGVQGLTIRNSRFTNCAVFDILLSRIGSDPAPRDIVIENTVLEASQDVGGKTAYFAMMTGEDPLDGLTLRNNTWDLGLALQGPVTRGVITGNIGRAASCAPSIRYSHNVFTDKRCGSSDRVVRGAFSQFVDPAQGDWRLKPRAAAIGAADPKAAPVKDAAGKARVKRPDAGAFEFRG